MGKCTPDSQQKCNAATLAEQRAQEFGIGSTHKPIDRSQLKPNNLCPHRGPYEELPSVSTEANQASDTHKDQLCVNANLNLTPFLEYRQSKSDPLRPLLGHQADAAFFAV